MNDEAVICKHCGNPLRPHEAERAEKDFANRTLQGFCAVHHWQDLTPSEQQSLIDAVRRGAFRNDQ